MKEFTLKRGQSHSAASNVERLSVRLKLCSAMKEFIPMKDPTIVPSVIRLFDYLAL